MGKTCQLKKRCCICEKEKHNLQFQSSEKGRVRVKSHCKTCKPIYEGIRKGLIKKEYYVGMDYDVTQLQGDAHGKLILLKEGGQFEFINLEQAIRRVKQGLAYVTSTSTIQAFPKNVLDGKSLKEYVLQRDGRRCYYCGEHGTTLDHVVPRWNGGLDSPLNMVACCEDCNQKKANHSESYFLKCRDMVEIAGKMVAHLKKCVCCEKSLTSEFFHDQEKMCIKCMRFQNGLQLGFITKEKIKQVKITSPVMTYSENVLFDYHHKKRLGVITLNEAKKLLELGVITLVEANAFQLIYDDIAMKQLFPFLRYETKLLNKNANAIKIINLKKAELKYHVKQMNYHKIRVYDITKRRILDEKGKQLFVKKQQAIQLLKNEQAYSIGENALRLIVPFSSIKKDIQSVSKQSTNGFKKKPVKQQENIISITLKELQVEQQKQQRKKSKKKTESKYERLWNQLKKERVSLFEQTGVLLKQLPKEMAIDLVRTQCAEILSQNQIRLRKPLKEVVKEHPKYAIDLLIS